MIRCFVFLLATLPVFGQLPTVSQGDIVAHDQRLTKGIGTSKAGELTIASFNIRNLGSRGRSFADYEELVNIMDEADVVLIQEAGLGFYDKNEGLTGEKEQERTHAMTELFKIFFGPLWTVVSDGLPSGSGPGAETSILIHRKQAEGYGLSAAWTGFVDLGERREMGSFLLTASNESGSEKIAIGSVHLKPDDPERGEEMNLMTDWLIQQAEQNLQAIVMGDMNWGYAPTKDVENYLGENRISQLHKDGKIYQLFAEISYLKKGKDGALRTNMGFRKSAYFYDQFVMTPNLGKRLADGGELLKDCGIYAFGGKGRMKKLRGDATKRKMKAIDAFIKNAGLDVTQHQEAYDKTMAKMQQAADNEATFLISDHRLVWVQFKLF